MEKKRNVTMNTQIQIEEAFTSHSKIEEVFMHRRNIQEKLLRKFQTHLT